jgi:hypothetical protein
MTRLSAKYVAAVDSCTRCPDRPLVAPDGMGTGTDAGSVVLTYRCTLGHCWERTFTRSAIKRGTTKATAARRRHLATTAATATTATTATTNDNADDCTERTRAARQPSPKTGWHPDRRLWLPR